MTAVLPALSSALPALSLLDDPERELQQHALQQLDMLVDTCWPEIATNIPKMSAEQMRRARARALHESRVGLESRCPRTALTVALLCFPHLFHRSSFPFAQ